MRNGLKTLLFMSAVSPVFFVLAYIRYNTLGLDSVAIELIVVGFLGCSVPILIMALAVRTGEKLRFEAKKIESNDFGLIGFVVSYLLPFVLRGASIEFNYIVLTAALVSVVLWGTTNLPAHPILSMMRYKFYKVESSSGVVYWLISTSKLMRPQDIRMVTKISDTMLMEVA